MSVDRRVVLVVIVLLVAGHPVCAQRTQGLIRDSTTGEPVSGAVVTVNDSAGRFLARTIADAGGRFDVARLDGSAVLSIIRIGYQPRRIKLAANDSMLLVPMPQIAVSLSTVKATGRRVCPGDKGESEALDLWEQARAALMAGLVARQINAPSLRLLSYERTLDPVKKKVEEERREAKTIVADRPYVAARPAWAFARDGYLREEINGGRTYLAPDEAVMLDESFAATHCMRVVNGQKEHGNDVGIGFDPAKIDGRDTLVDIKGTLWIDRRTPELRSVEFEYTGLEPIARGSGGKLEFQMMPNGAPAIIRWTIHTSILALDPEPWTNGITRRPPPRDLRTNVRVLGYRESGGEVAVAVWPDGTRWDGSKPRLIGVVIDTAGREVKRAMVWLVGKSGRDSVVTGDDGSFAFPVVFPDKYVVFASDSLLGEYGVRLTAPWLLALSSGETHAKVTLRPRSEVFRASCSRQQTAAERQGVILGKVVSADGAPMPKLRVDASWMSLDAPASGDDTRKVESDDAGRFLICGAPVGRPVRIRATTTGESADVTVDKWTDDIVAFTLVLKRVGVGR